MLRNQLWGSLVILMFVLLVSNLFADKANQQQLEAQFRTATHFNGTITWWDSDDTMKELKGDFSNMDLFRNHTKEGMDKAVDSVFLSLLPHAGLPAEDFYAPDITYDHELKAEVYTYYQMFKGKSIDGFIRIYVLENNLDIKLYLVTKVNMNNKKKITKARSYDLFVDVCDLCDKVPPRDTVAELKYLAWPYDRSKVQEQKPTDFTLVWYYAGQNKRYYINAETGELIQK